MNALDVVAAQLAAFNAHDVEAFVATYAPQAVVSGVVAEPIVGREALTDFYRPRFENPQLSCEIETVVQFGDRWVVAREYVRNGEVITETIATFDIADSLIQRASMLKA
jgi:uncharacterized protein (TIGR02246 family)